MYIAAVRMADEFGCATHRHSVPAGTEGSAACHGPGGRAAEQRRPAAGVGGRNGRILYEGEALPHFNEVDECAGLDGLMTNRVWRKLGFEPENTLHDLRYGEDYNGEFVWVFVISGAAPPRISLAANRRRQRAPAAHVLSGRRRHAQGRQQAGRNRLEPRLSSRTTV